MGTGDWNDGMGRVGAGGKGESVWLAWFLIDTLRRFAAIAEDRHDGSHSARHRDQAEALRAAIEGHAWTAPGIVAPSTTTGRHWGRPGTTRAGSTRSPRRGP